MSWRTVVIANRCKLDLKMGYMVVRGEETKRIFLDEIAMVIIENPAVALTGCLVSALIAKKIKVIFCDEQRNPASELVSLYGSHDCSAKIKAQMAWSKDIKGTVWTEIVKEKIKNQAKLLSAVGKELECKMLQNYISQIEFNDATNREGHAAKVYFNALFGKGFSRSIDVIENAALNYGYSVLLSAINREISINGYLTQIGLFHDNIFNFFNLGSDLIEPYRIVVDQHVKFNKAKEFNSEEKHEIVSLLHKKVLIENTNQTLLNSIKIYVRSVFNALNEEDVSLIRFMEYEL